MVIKLSEGMRFQHNPIEKGNEFTIRKYDFYDDGNPIWCAVTEEFISPSSEIILDAYIPMVDGKWINEPNEYVE